MTTFVYTFQTLKYSWVVPPINKSEALSMRRRIKTDYRYPRVLKNVLILKFKQLKLTLNKEEKLKSKRLIGELFDQGKSLSKFPLRLVYLKAEHSSKYPIKIAFSAPKRKFKKAVDRNRIKRLMREAYRKNKHILYNSVEEKHIIMFTYIDENELKYVEIEEKLILLLKRLSDKIKS